MRFGFAPVQSQATFDAMRRQAQLAEALGFDTLWAHEHHSQGMMYPDPLMALAALAPATEKIRLRLRDQHHRDDRKRRPPRRRLSPRPRADARAPERVSKQHFVIGEPAECIEQIQAYAGPDGIHPLYGRSMTRWRRVE